MIPQRLELRTYPYQEYALPIKLRNLIIKLTLLMCTRFEPATFVAETQCSTN